MEINESIDQPAFADTPTPEVPALPREPAPPISSRFLFVDVAGLRAKQLRRGARLRFELDHGAAPIRKPERMAMEEVRRGLVQYYMSAPKANRTEGDE
jgi:DNA-directed RNA polymerase subunit K/omega